MLYDFLLSETEAGIFRQILRGKLDFESEPWPSISDSAKDLVRNMLTWDLKRDLVLMRFSVSTFLPSSISCSWVVDTFPGCYMGYPFFIPSIIALSMPYSGHPWIVDDAVAPDKPIDSAVLSRLKHFSAMNKLKKMALRVWIFTSPYLM